MQDTAVATFKQWLRLRLKRARRDEIDEFANRLIDDTRIPGSGSHALFLAYLRAKGYSHADQVLFESAWAEMRSSM